MTERTNADLIRETATEAGLSRARLAEMLRVSPHTVDAWLKPTTSRSHCRPPDMAVELLCLKLGRALPPELGDD
jgi:DNA-binding transcriptional regulator YiaG